MKLLTIFSTIFLFIAMLSIASCALMSQNLKSIDLDSDTVIIYTTSWCDVCDQAIEFFETYNIDYIRIDYENKKEFDRLVNLSHNLNFVGIFFAVPIIIVRKHILVGYNPNIILHILDSETSK